MSKMKDSIKKIFSKIAAFSLSTIGKGLAKLILRTCKFEIEGLDKFLSLATKQKCILMLWHNRLALTSFILYHYARQFTYAAVISNSRDGELIGSLVRSYQAGSTIKVPHDSRHEALREIIRHLKDKNDIVVITPDGPRGPCYEMKPGVALAAAMTGAHVIPFSWQASNCWELNTWDKLRFPKPFSTIKVIFDEALHFKKCEETSQVQNRLQKALDNLTDIL